MAQTILHNTHGFLVKHKRQKATESLRYRLIASFTLLFDSID